MAFLCFTPIASITRGFHDHDFNITKICLLIELFPILGEHQNWAILDDQNDTLQSSDPFSCFIFPSDVTTVKVELIGGMTSQKLNPQ